MQPTSHITIGGVTFEIHDDDLEVGQSLYANPGNMRIWIMDLLVRRDLFWINREKIIERMRCDLFDSDEVAAETYDAVGRWLVELDLIDAEG